MLEQILQNHLVQRVRVKSAVNPSLWAMAVITLPLFFLATKVEGLIQVFFLIGGSVPLVTFLVSHLFFTFWKPECLRSEDFQLKLESLKYLGDKDNPRAVKLAESVVRLINNPSLPIPDSHEKDNE